MRCPAALPSRLITARGWSEVTTRRHLPAPSPSAPVSASQPAAGPVSPHAPDSSTGALSVHAARAGRVRVTALSPGCPAESVPVRVTAASEPERFTSRSRLSKPRLLAGLKKATA